MGASRQKQKAVIAKVEGGLGNQMFIYAAAKGLAVRNNVPLKLDVVSGYLNDVYGRQFCLDHFNIEAEIAAPKESFASALGPKRRYWTRKINRLLPFSHRSYIEEEKVFDKRLLGLKVIRGVYLQGYWQDERYFKDIEDIVRENFTITIRHEKKNIEWARRISQSNAVCVHARRWNYEYALPMTYYRDAIKYVTRRVEDPHFYCFSDNPEWVERNLAIDYRVTNIRHNRETKDFEDLWLMTQCKHYIIANSSFSWWGAWLNSDPEKIVVVPARWGYSTGIPGKWKAL
jgi:hypothetical protein